MSFKEIDVGELAKRINPITTMRTKDWFLVTGEKDGKVNTMTAAWGTFGNVWERKIVTLFIRPQRYTKEFIDSNDKFTMTFFDGKLNEMTLLGRISGKENPNKIADAGLHIVHVNGMPTFEEASLVANCKVLYKAPLMPELFEDASILDKCYSNKDYSVMYIAEIMNLYEKELQFTALQRPVVQ